MLDDRKDCRQPVARVGASLTEGVGRGSGLILNHRDKRDRNLCSLEPPLLRSEVIGLGSYDGLVLLPLEASSPRASAAQLVTRGHFRQHKRAFPSLVVPYRARGLLRAGARNTSRSMAFDGSGRSAVW